MYQSNFTINITKVRRANELKHITLSVRHGGGGIMATSGTRSLVFIHDVTTDRSSRLKCEVYVAVRLIKSNAA